LTVQIGKWLSGPGDENDVINQPAEFSYVIGKLLAMSAKSHGVISGLVDSREVAVAGRSGNVSGVAALVSGGKLPPS
jgi:predicted dienelactone hydrolase